MAFAVAALALAALIGPGASQGSTTKPSLVIVKLTPLTIRGTSFEAGEAVRITFSTRAARASLRVTANRNGAFVGRFAVLLAVEPCRGALVITAEGARGSRATLRRPCRPGDPLPP